MRAAHEWATSETFLKPRDVAGLKRLSVPAAPVTSRRTEAEGRGFRLGTFGNYVEYSAHTLVINICLDHSAAEANKTDAHWNRETRQRADSLIPVPVQLSPPPQRVAIGCP